MAGVVSEHKPRYFGRPKTKQNTEDVLYIRSLPPEEKAAFKAKCARNGITLSLAIQALVRAYLKNSGICQTEVNALRREMARARGRKRLPEDAPDAELPPTPEG